MASPCNVGRSHAWHVRSCAQVCELDLIFNFHKAYYILDELVIAGELQETSKKAVLRVCAQQDAMMDESRDKDKDPRR
jgi:AP-1 complex subunit sigma 1/2